MPDGVTNIAMHGALVEPFKEWLASRGLELVGPMQWEISADDIGSDNSYFFIGISDAKWEEHQQDKKNLAADRLAAQDDARGERDR